MTIALALVHGVGPVRNVSTEIHSWVEAIREGAVRAGHSRVVDHVLRENRITFAHYADLFDRPVPQGRHVSQGMPRGTELIDDVAMEVTTDLLAEALDTQLDRDLPDDVHGQLKRARVRLRPQGRAQGVPAIARHLTNAVTTLLEVPGLRRTGQWVSGSDLVGHLGQVGRYLSRGEADVAGVPLCDRAVARVVEALDAGPAVVVAHSLGSVVAMEALHRHHHEVPLFVTLGSPLGMRTVVHPRLRPHPPQTPECVGLWLNFWDRDDVVAARPILEADVRANARGVTPVSRRVDSDGLWVHPAVTYLRQGEVAGRVIEALTSSTTVR